MLISTAEAQRANGSQHISHRARVMDAWTGAHALGSVGRQRKVYWDQRSGVLRSGDASERKLKGSSRATRTLREACWAGRAHGRECGAGSAACAAHVRGMFTDLERPQAAFEAVGLSSGKKVCKRL